MARTRSFARQRHTSVVPRPRLSRAVRRPPTHRIGKRDAKRRAQLSQQARRIHQQVGGIDDGWLVAGCGGSEHVQLALASEPQIFGDNTWPLGEIRGDHRRRFANQERVSQRSEPWCRWLEHHVMRHLLLILDDLAGWQRRRESGNHGVRLVGLAGKNLGPHRMIGAAPGQIDRIKRLVDDRAIAARFE